MFKCECGKEFENGQSFNGHKSHCKIHYIAKYGSDKAYLDMCSASTARIQAGFAEHNKQKQKTKQAATLLWVAEQHKCKTCGKVMTVKFGRGLYCSRSCANTRAVSLETRAKIAITQAKKMKEAWQLYPETWLANKDLPRGRRFSPIKKCIVCGKPLRYENKSGFCASCLHNTEEGCAAMNAAGKKGYQTMLKNGTHHPWQSRKIKSYAEAFWERVLINNGIAFSREVVVPHENSNYFLDFLIQINGKCIDLEIDGKQHRYTDRRMSDQRRDEYLKGFGYLVYRIPWNGVNSAQGKEKMRQKIEKFLAFYYSI